MDKANSLAQLQKMLLNDELVCKLEVEAITPIWIGGYETEAIHDELGRESLRPSSVKGVWRWWARSLVSAAIYELQGKYPNIREADEVVSRLMGKGGENAHQSLYQIIVEEAGDVVYLSLPDHGEEGQTCRRSREELLTIDEVARVRLQRLSKAKNKISFIDSGSRFDIWVYRRSPGQQLSEVYDAFAIHSLVLALTLGGVGKATTRGFGKFKVLSASISNEAVYQKIGINYEHIFKEEIKNVNDVKTVVEKLFEIGVRLAKNILSNETVEAGSNLPVFETPVKNFFKIDVPNKIFDKDVLALKAIGRATLKLEWKKAKGMNIKARGDKINTWILGLPRFQLTCTDVKENPETLKGNLRSEMHKAGCTSGYVEELLARIRKERRNKRECVYVPTGYWECIIGEKLRRRSPIIFTPLKSKNGKYYVAIIGFQTSDWENIKLFHIGFLKEPSPHFKVISIPTYQKDVLKAFHDAMNTVKDIIERG